MAFSLADRVALPMARRYTLIHQSLPPNGCEWAHHPATDPCLADMQWRGVS